MHLLYTVGQDWKEMNIRYMTAVPATLGRRASLLPAEAADVDSPRDVYT